MSMAKLNTTRKAERKHLLSLIALMFFALVGSAAFSDAHAASPKPEFQTLTAFHLLPNDTHLYQADYAWCMPTPTTGYQCYVLGSEMVGFLGQGSADQYANATVYGDIAFGLVKMNDLPEKAREDALRSFNSVWGE